MGVLQYQQIINRRCEEQNAASLSSGGLHRLLHHSSWYPGDLGAVPIPTVSGPLLMRSASLIYRVCVRYCGEYALARFGHWHHDETLFIVTLRKVVVRSRLKTELSRAAW